MFDQRRVTRRVYSGALVLSLLVFLVDGAAGVPLDKKGEIQFGLRAYTAVRIGTEETTAEILSDGVRQVARNVTFPQSSAGSVRQHRGFLELEVRHDLSRLLKEGFGPLALLKMLPFKIKQMRYFISYRGEYEGIYDYGPSEFRTAEQFLAGEFIPGGGPEGGDIGQFSPAALVLNSPFPESPSRREIAARDRRTLRDVGTSRNRLFQAYMQAKAGKVTLRLGRQIIAWGETDIFRLMDNINPLDASFGGFLVSLDERRVPLDMARVTWYLGDFSKTGIPGMSVLSNLPWYEAYIEAFIAIDDEVGFAPGTPKGSAWGLPNVHTPTESILTETFQPHRSLSDSRGGAQFRFSAPVPLIGDVALGLAHYYTYFDIPAVRVLSNGFPTTIGLGEDRDSYLGPQRNYTIWAQQTAPRVRVSGVFGNFALPPEWVRPLGISGEPIVRFETAFFEGEPRNSQTSLDPFIHSLGGCPGGKFVRSNGEEIADPDNFDGDQYCSAGARTGDSWNVAVGLDINQWFRWLNPNSSFFITTQFFYKHLRGAERREPLSRDTLPNLPGVSEENRRRFFPYLAGQRQINLGEVLPVQRQNISTDVYLGTLGENADAAVPNFAPSPVDQFLQTLLIASPYYGGRVLPSMAIFYDWANAWVLQPSLTYSVDPFRFTFTYNFLSATDLKGGQGISLLQDRDNFLFQFEYVI